MKGATSISGVYEYYDFRDNLIVDKYDPLFQEMRKNKINHLRSENSEDAITWNVFRTLLQINPKLWYPHLLSYGLGVYSDYDLIEDYPEEIDVPRILKIKLWESLEAPPLLSHYQNEEGPTEVDIIIESEEFVWFIEAKYKSDIAVRTANNDKRNQILRNLDVGTLYAGVRDFYFSLLIVDEKKSKMGSQLVTQYNQELIQSREKFVCQFLHRPDGLQNLKGLSVFYWQDIAAILKYCSIQDEDQYERFVADRAYKWLETKKKISIKGWLDQDLSNRFLTYPKELEYILKIQEFAQRSCNQYENLIMPKGFDENGWPTNSILENYDYLGNYWHATELAFSQFNECGLPWWWHKRGIKEFSVKFFEVLEECEELGYMSEEEYWYLFQNDPEETLRISYFLLFNWYELREK